MDEKERIEKLMETENLNSTQFALEIGIQSSTLSHILNGRNKPSLDVLKRILNRFRTINSDWLILGVGSMYRATNESQQAVLFDIKPETNTDTDIYTEKTEEKSVLNLERNRKKEEFSIEKREFQTIPVKTISKIVVFYSDNTFEEITR